MTFEPSEVEELPIPIKGSERLDIPLLDELTRNREWEKVMDITDKILLKDTLGYSQERIDKLRSIWKKMQQRRIGRKSR